MEHSTRERAIQAALELWATKGSESVTMEAVAQAIGIKAPSLYKHFQNRAELMSLLESRLEEDYLRRQENLVGQLKQLEKDLKALGLISPQRFDQEVLAYLEPAMTSPQSRAYRQMLAQGLSRGPQGGNEYFQKTLLLPLSKVEDFFEAMAGQNIFRRGESHVMALELVSPLSHLVSMADVQVMSGGDLEDIRQEVLRHLKQFHRVYAVREKPAEKPVEKPAFSGLGTGGKRLFRGNR